MARLLPVLVALVSLLQPCFATAEARVYIQPAEFIAAVFSDAAPQVQVLWLTPALREQTEHILGHAPGQLRQKYWRDGQKTAWILEETGKEDLITAGFVIKDGHIEQTRVLIYRESRGGEIRLPAFLAQFRDAMLTDDNRLSRQIDGISGATLSVNAMVRMSRLALYFAHVANNK